MQVEMGLNETLGDLKAAFTKPERWLEGCKFDQGDLFEFSHHLTWRLIWKGREWFQFGDGTRLSELRTSGGQGLADFCDDDTSLSDDGVFPVHMVLLVEPSN